VTSITHHTRHGIHWRAEQHPSGLTYIEHTAWTDLRGRFDRIYDPAILAELNCPMEVAEIAQVSNPIAKTLRGMHYQEAPYAQAKLVQVLRGEVLDIVLDLRIGTTYGFTAAPVLKPGALLYVPAGFAHGYLTLEANTVVQYLMSRPYEPAAARGVHWSTVNIRPLVPELISGRDEALPMEWPRL